MRVDSFAFTTGVTVRFSETDAQAIGARCGDVRGAR